MAPIDAGYTLKMHQCLSAPSAPYLNVLNDSFLLPEFNFLGDLLSDESELRETDWVHDEDLPEVYFSGYRTSVGPFIAEKSIAKVLNRISFFIGSEPERNIPFRPVVQGCRLYQVSSTELT